jgi:autotransporter-associated beta strand protein
VALLGVLAVSALPASGQYTDLPGDLFLQQNVPQAPFTTGIVINNPQDMGGGNWVGGSTSNYPVSGNSPVLDGSGTNTWYAGTFDPSGGGMCNVGITSGVYSADASSFTNVPFGAIDTIRIYAQNYLNSPPNNWWVTFPQQVEIGYTTASFNPGNGYSYNSGTLGVLPGTWNNVATITAVNGAPVLSATSNNSAYGTGWANLNGDFTQGLSILGPSSSSAYVDLTVAIPAGATSICVSFGQDNSGTGNPGGLAIAGIQATLHPTWSNAAATGVWDTSTVNWSSAAAQPVTYSDAFPVTFDDTGGGGTVTIQGTGSPSQVKPYSVTFNNNATNYTLTGDPIGGAATMALTGTGTVTLANANTFTGTTSANNGTLNLSNSNALQNSTLVMGSGNVVFDQSVTGHAFTLGGLSGSGSLALQDNASPTPNAVALTVGGNNANTVFSGALSGSGSLIKTGNGMLTLTGANLHAGGPIVSQGTLAAIQPVSGNPL